MQYIYLLLLIPLIFTFPSATKIRTQDGTVYNGEIVSENSNFLILSVNGKHIQILKSRITEIDAKRCFSRNDAPDIIKNSLSNSISSKVNSLETKRSDSLTISGSDNVTVVLKNGSIFKGPILSQNDRIIILNVNGSPVNIFKNIISEIVLSGKQVHNTSEEKTDAEVADSSLTGLSLQSGKKHDYSSLGESASKNVSLSIRNDYADYNVNANDGVPAGVIINNNEINVKRSDTINIVSKHAQKKITVQSNKSAHLKTVSDKSISLLQKKSESEPNLMSEKKDVLKATEVSGHDTSMNTNIKKEKAVFNKGTSGTDSTLITTGTQSKLPVNTSPTDEKRMINNISLKTFESKKIADSKDNTNNDLTNNDKKIAATDVSLPAKKENKRVLHGDTVQIVLKNGANFIGKIIYEDDRVIRFEVGEAVINILKHLIKEIDGNTFDNGTFTLLEKSAFAADADWTIKNNSLPDRSNLFTDRSENVAELSRIFPKVSVPDNVQVVKLKDSLYSTSPERRSLTARTLAAIGQWGTEAIPDLRKLLSDTALSENTPPVLIDSSNVNNLLSPGDEAARALSRMGTNGFSVLKTALKNENSLVRQRAAFGLGELSTEAAYSALIDALNDSDYNVRAVAVSGLRFVKFADVLINMLKDENAIVRANAAFMLGKMRQDKAVRSLKALLYDHRSIVRVRAAEALCMIGGKNAISVLIDATTDSDFNVRENAAFALGETGDSTAVQPLLNLLRDKITTVRSAAITALSKIKDPRSIPSLYSMLKDKDAEIRQQAQVALKELTDVGILINSLDCENPNVRKNVYYLLWLMTGQDIEMDKNLWQNWYSESQANIKGLQKSSY